MTSSVEEGSSAGGGFDAAQVAAAADEHGEDPLRSVLGQLAGFASTCWVGGTGSAVFDSEAAAAALDSTVEWLETGGLGPLADLDRVRDGELALVSLPADTPPELATEVAAMLERTIEDRSERFLLFRGAQLLSTDRLRVSLGPATYVEYSSEWLAATVGPFTDREHADAWAGAFTGGGVAEWSGARVLTPAQAALEVFQRREMVGGPTAPAPPPAP